MQTVHDSCRVMTQIQFRKEAGLPLELTDEMNYKCGDGVTATEVQYSAGLRAIEPAHVLDTLLQPAVVSMEYQAGCSLLLFSVLPHFGA